jgi:hypothetical protein
MTGYPVGSDSYDHKGLVRCFPVGFVLWGEKVNSGMTACSAQEPGSFKSTARQFGDQRCADTLAGEARGRGKGV